MAKSILIDCDAGIDDAQALFMALCSPEVNVVAITVVQGNVLPRQVSLNVLRILRVADRLDVSIKSMYFRRFHLSLCTCTDSFLCGFLCMVGKKISRYINSMYKLGTHANDMIKSYIYNKGRKKYNNTYFNYSSIHFV